MNNISFVLGLFPEFGNGNFGGIQASASAAWEAMRSGADVQRICYANPVNEVEVHPTANPYPRLRAILAVVKQRRTPGLLLVWHIGLLKLLPFFRTRPRKVMLFLHGIEAWKRQDWLTERLCNRVDLFLSNSDYTWQRFLSYYPDFSKAPHEVVPLGLHSALTDDLPKPDTRPIALILSRLSKDEDYKGHRELIGIWPQVLRKIPDAELWIAGDGNLRPELEEMTAAHEVSTRVKFLGKVSEEQKQKLLQQSRCFLMPSRGEGFGLVYLEAMRMGRPCLVSTLDAGREVVNPPEAGLAANPDSEEELASAIRRLLADGPEWHQWSEQARRRYEESFTAKHYQERLLAALFSEETRKDPRNNTK